MRSHDNGPQNHRGQVRDHVLDGVTVERGECHGGGPLVMLLVDVLVKLFIEKLLNKLNLFCAKISIVLTSLWCASQWE